MTRLLVLLFCLYMPLSSAVADDWQFSGVDRIVAVGDIHGAYEAMVATLQEADVIDDNLAWSGADTHLVLTGDLLDRGPGSRQVMDLVMRMEREAIRAGGQVHLLLGNHEVMNLIGDVRYVSDPEYAAFSEDESAQEREYWYQVFRQSQPEDADERKVRSEFNQKAPPGYFGYRRAFRRDGFYGKWLLEKPLMIVVNGTAFVHGGVPPFVAEHGLEGVNGALKTDLLNYVTALSTLEDASILSPVDRFRGAPSILTSKLENGQLDDALVAPAQAILRLRKSPLYGAEGPTWYRGTALCNPLIEGDDLNASLNKIGATRVVFGHTVTGSRRVQQRMNGQIIEIDTGMLTTSYQGSGNALILEDEMVKVVNQDGADNLMPIAHPRYDSDESETMDDKALEDILTNGSIAEATTEGATWKLIQVTAFDKTVFAYFNAQPEEKGFVPELAAYRLDRMLSLNMIPVTVRREIAGQQGTLQYIPEEIISERTRVIAGKGNRASCSLSKQRGAMYVFDALINNPARTPLSMMYDPDDWQLILIDHRDSFSTKKGWPAYLRNIRLTLGDQWRKALLEIDDRRMRENLGDVLGKKHLAALANRRDDLVKHSSR